MMERNHNIDIIKAVAIIAVILLHSLPREILFLTGSPFHIWQTVPVFLVLAGYNSANSFKRRNQQSLSQFYNFSYLYKKLERLIYPFILIWVLQVAAHFILADGLNVKELTISFLSGGWGPGSYFIPIIVQSTLILPFIYLLCRKNLTTMVIVLFGVSLVTETFCLLIDMPESVYRLLIIRYLFALTLGVWLVLNPKNLNYKWLIPLSIVSLVYIVGVNYFDWVLIMEDYWLSQHAPSYFWTLLLIIAGFKLYKFKAENIVSKSTIKIGQASYHIFLMQMVYFWGIAGRLPDMPGVIHLGVNVVICLILGLLFFELENRIRKLMKSRKKINKSVA